jgi:hypothetical protein
MIALVAAILIAYFDTAHMFSNQPALEFGTATEHDPAH